MLSSSRYNKSNTYSLFSEAKWMSGHVFETWLHEHEIMCLNKSTPFYPKQLGLHSRHKHFQGIKSLAMALLAPCSPLSPLKCIHLEKIIMKSQSGNLSQTRNTDPDLFLQHTCQLSFTGFSSTFQTLTEEFCGKSTHIAKTIHVESLR